MLSENQIRLCFEACIVLEKSYEPTDSEYNQSHFITGKWECYLSKGCGFKFFLIRLWGDLWICKSNLRKSHILIVA